MHYIHSALARVVLSTLASSMAAFRSMSIFKRPAVVLIAILLAAPFSGAHARDTGLIFASFGSLNDVVVIDPQTGATIKNLKTSRGPRDLQFNADHTRLYIACRDDDVIDVVDVARLEVVGRLNTLSQPETFGIDEKRRRLYVAHHEGASVTIIDLDQNVVVQEIATDAGPGSIFVDEDGRFVYVASIIGDFIDRIDADRGYVVDAVTVGTKPHRIAPTPDRRNLLVASELSSEIHFIDMSSFTVAGRLRFAVPDAGATRMTVDDFLLTRDGKTAYVVLGLLGRVAAVDVPTHKIKDYIPVGERSASLGLSRDEATLFVANMFGGDITAINIRSHEVTASIPLHRRPWAFVIDD